eukprot:233081-Prymnesium_polylepis.1
MCIVVGGTSIQDIAARKERPDHAALRARHGQGQRPQELHAPPEQVLSAAPGGTAPQEETK